LIKNMANLNAREFKNKLIRGERDFRKTAIPNNTDLTPYIQEINEGISLIYSANNCFDFRGSKLKYLQAPGIRLPHADFSHAILEGSNLEGAFLFKSFMHETYISKANLSDCDLRESHFVYADCIGTDFSRAILNDSNLRGIVLNRANLSQANLSGTDLRQADFRKVLGLDSVIGLNEAIINDVIVTAKEKKLIERARNQVKYDVRRS
jgi:uncharacterized protein YjbI with pentapeptide repeats